MFLCTLKIRCKTGNQIRLISQWKTSNLDKKSDENQVNYWETIYAIKTYVQSAFQSAKCSQQFTTLVNGPVNDWLPHPRWHVNVNQVLLQIVHVSCWHMTFSPACDPKPRNQCSNPDCLEAKSSGPIKCSTTRARKAIKSQARWAKPHLSWFSAASENMK